MFFFSLNAFFAIAKHTDTAVKTNPVEGSKLNSQIAEKPKPKRRKTMVCFTPIKYDDAILHDILIGNDDSCKKPTENGENVAKHSMMPERKNTDQEMYSKNPLYKSWCLFCDSKDEPFLVLHHMKNHPNHEFPISRVSPTMAQLIREKKNLKFTKEKDKISGTCVFCEIFKTMTKSGWEKHLISHTGERMFYCSSCKVCLTHKNNHDVKCSGNPENIFAANDTNGSLTGFMCNHDCNYLKIRRSQLVKHLENEHGCNKPQENCDFTKFTLLVDKYISSRNCSD